MFYFITKLISNISTFYFISPI